MPAVPADLQQAGIYLHIPFCQQKCLYCAFYSLVPQPGDVRRFLEAVHLHLQQAARLPLLAGLRFTSIFFGGGTPSLLSAQDLATLLTACRHFLPCASLEELEISIEANPAMLRQSDFQLLRQAGFNRLSLGVQSMQDQELTRLGRIHSAAAAAKAVQAARQAGFANLSIDLMYGLPGQTLASWRRSLTEILDLQPDHLSLYELSLEPGTPLTHQLTNQHTLLDALPAEDEVLDMMDEIETQLDASPLQAYELSNYARSGHQCRHNLFYWHNTSWLGIGPGAVSSLAGCKLRVAADFPAYAACLHSGTALPLETETLDTEAAFRETVIMGLRLREGVCLAELQRRFAIDARQYYGQILSRLLELQLLHLHEGLGGEYLALSAHGRRLANQVMAELV